MLTECRCVPSWGWLPAAGARVPRHCNRSGAPQLVALGKRCITGPFFLTCLALICSYVPSLKLGCFILLS